MLAVQTELASVDPIVAAVAAHERWLASGGCEGARADFTGADLRQLHLSGADLRNAVLVRTDLSDAVLDGCNLSCADLTQATLCSAVLTGVNVRQARLYNVDFEGADLRQVKSLKSSQLCGCNLTHAALPPNIEFHGLEQAKESAGRLAVQFVSVLTLCLYAWLTIGSTKDVDLLTNARSVSFPFIDLSLPILGFYLLVPIALPALSTALFVHLSTYWDNVASLPAFFPDGSEVTARTPPMLLDRLVQQYMVRLSSEVTHTSRVYAWLITAGLFGVVPITLFAFWLRYLPRHDPFGTALQLTALLGFLIYTMFLDASMKAKLRLAREHEPLFAGRWRELALYAATCVALAVISAMVLYGPRLPVDFFYADLSGEAVSPKPDAKGDSDGAGASSFYAVSLAGMNLRHADLTGASAMTANFSRANLERARLDGALLKSSSFRDAGLTDTTLHRAHLESADLRRARLFRATLTGAELAKADLTQADLRRADLAGAHVGGATFSRVNLTAHANAAGVSGENAVFALALMTNIQLSRAVLTKSNFFLADLRDAHLWRADLRGSSFIIADLTGANFTQANLTDADLSQANLRGTVLESATLTNAKLICTQLYDAFLTNADLTGANLHSAQLRGAVLRGARLTRADLTDASLEAADLDGADLRGVDLSNTTGLTREQLTKALIDGQTILPATLQP